MHSRYIGKDPPPGVVEQTGAQAPLVTADSAPAPPREPLAVPEPPAAAVPGDALRVQTLGGFAVWRGLEPIAPAVWTRRKVVATLMKQLLSAQACRLPREQVMDRLWPGAEPATAATNLRYTVHLLRKLLDRPDAAWSHVRTEGDVLVLAPSAEAETPDDWLDALAFEREARHALAGQEAEACAAALQRYQGDYLPDDIYSDWVEARREELRTLRLSVWLHEAELRSAQGDAERAAACLHEVLRADPSHEAAGRALMRLQAAAGRRTEAMATYKRLSEALRRDLDLAPEPLTRALYAELLAGKLSPSARAQPALPLDALEPAQPAFDMPALPDRELVGRTAALHTLTSLVRQAGEGTGSVVLVHGAAGAGKSRLLGACIRTARQTGALMLVGHAYQHEGRLPYGPLQEALRGYVTAQAPALLQAQVAYHSVLVRLVPELARLLPDLPPPAPLDAKAERHRLFAAFGGLLEDLGARLPADAPVLLILEDLQWADVTTLQAIHFLQRACAAGRVVLMGSYREEDVEPGGPLDQLITRLRDTGQAMLAVESFNDEESAQLIDHLLAPHAVANEARARVAEQARGNPLFIRELIASLREAGALQVREGVWQLSDALPVKVPTSVQGLFLDRMRRLDDDAMRLARLCAVFGQDLNYLLLREASDLPEETLLDALEALLEVGLLEETATPQATPVEAAYPAYAIHHPLFREALYQQIPPPRRLHPPRRAPDVLHGGYGDRAHGDRVAVCRQSPPPRRLHLHRRAADVLERGYGDRAHEHAAELAWQFGQAALYAPAAYYAVLAGDQAARAAAVPEALAQYQRALAHLAHSPAFDGTPYAAPSVGAVEEKLGDLRLLAGEYASAQEAFSRARAMDASPARHAELWLKEAATWERRGEFERALALLDAADAEGLGPDGLLPGVRARLVLSRCSIHSQRGAYEAARVTAHTVVELAQQGGDTHVLARAYQLLGNIAMQQHDLRAAETYCRRALALWEQDAANPRIQQEIARSWMGLGNVAHLRGDRAEADTALRRALAINERIGYASGVAACWNNLGNVAFAAGDLAAARDCYRRGLAVWERTGDQYRVGHAWNNLGGVALALGDLAEADACFERSLAIQERIGNRTLRGICWQNLGDVALARGNLVLAVEQFRRALDILTGTGAQEAIASALIGRATVTREVGSPRAAAALARQARRLARQHQALGAEGAALLEEARDHLRTSHPHTASILIERARALAATSGSSTVALRVALLRAEAALVHGDLEPAILSAEEAGRLAEAGPYRREVALARYLVGCATLRRGQVQQATTLLRAAHDVQQTIGAQLDAAHTATALAAALLRSGSSRETTEAADLLETARATCRQQGALGDLAMAERLAEHGDAAPAMAAHSLSLTVEGIRS